MSSRARAVAVLQAMTRSSAPWSWRNLALETAYRAMVSRDLEP
jgi:hypothetical protein